jgi:uncharacterized membrane protein YfcA
MGLADVSAQLLAAVFAITLFAGFVKGAVGFAMPMIMISAFGSFLPNETALALLILPTLVTNVAQGFRDGPAAMWESVRTYRWHIAMVVIFLFVSAQFVHQIPDRLMKAVLGAPVLAFALWQLMGLPLAIPLHHRRGAEIGLGVIGGLYGGVSGIWGPPLIVYLVSIGAPKAEAVRVQGVVFLIGAAALVPAHLASGVLNRQTLPLSAFAAIPAMIGLWAGFRAHDRLDQATFRRWTLVLLAVTGANLVRQAIGWG